MEAPEKITAEKCFDLLTREFPALSGDLEGCEELEHLQLSAFSRFTRDALRSGDLETVRKCIRLADFIWKNATDEVVNAVGVSFLEHFDTRADYAPRLRELFTPSLNEGWDAIDRYMAELLGAQWTDREIDP